MCVLDVRKYEALEKAAEDAVKLFGRLDICVANAGIARTGSVLTFMESEFDDVLDVNLKVCFPCMDKD